MERKHVKIRILAKEIRSCAADRLLSLPQPQEKERMALWIKALLLALIVLVSEMLIREDYFHCRVPKWGLRSLLILAALLRSVALLENGSDPLSFMYSLTASLVRASLFILPLLLLYALKRSPGPRGHQVCVFRELLVGVPDCLCLDHRQLHLGRTGRAAEDSAGLARSTSFCLFTLSDLNNITLYFS